MKNIAFILLLISSNFIFAQGGKDSSNVTDAEGKRQGKWVLTNKMEKPPLPDYTDDQKVEEGRFVDGKKVGVWNTYYPNGNMKSRITFENGRPFGKVITYHENGKVFEEGLWRNNRWVGDYKMYHDNGEVQHDFKFNSTGKREGVQKYFTDAGVEIISGEMKDGKEVGKWIEHYDDGSLRAEKMFVDGGLDPATTKVYAQKTTAVAVVPDKNKEPIEGAPKGTTVTKVKEDEKPNPGAAAKPFDGEGQSTLFNKNKQVSKEGTFHKYQLVNGKAYIYNGDGILERIAVYKDGKYSGDAPLPVE